MPINRSVLIFLILAYLILSGFLSTVFAQNRSIIFRNASIIDGSGRPVVSGDIRIKHGKIVKIGKFKPSNDDEIVDSTGLILAPGFIDIHNHSESGLLREGSAANQVSQGITTVFVGPDGGSPFPLKDYFGKLDGKIAVNVGAFIGHATVREQVMKNGFARTATDDEIRQMAGLVDQSMKEGAFGLSSGLEYDTGFPPRPKS